MAGTPTLSYVTLLVSACLPAWQHGVASAFMQSPVPAKLAASAGTASRSIVGRGSSRLSMSDENYNRVQSIFDKPPEIEYMFENNRKWAEEALKNDPQVFERIKNSQAPKYLYIGCADSRVPAEMMLGLSPGELFVHRNVANQCMYTDYSFLAVLAYAVDVLEVTDIIVCGHYGCGGVRAAMENVDHGLVEHWLRSIRTVHRMHQEELRAISDPNERDRKIVELNVQEQCLNLFANPIVQKKQSLQAVPRIHGWVYDVATGLLKDVKIDFRTEITKYKDVYRLYEFPNQQLASRRHPFANVPKEAVTNIIEEVPEPTGTEDKKSLMPGWGRILGRG